MLLGLAICWRLDDTVLMGATSGVYGHVHLTVGDQVADCGLRVAMGCDGKRRNPAIGQYETRSPGRDWAQELLLTWLDCSGSYAMLAKEIRPMYARFKTDFRGSRGSMVTITSKVGQNGTGQDRTGGQEEHRCLGCGVGTEDGIIAFALFSEDYYYVSR